MRRGHHKLIHPTDCSFVGYLTGKKVQISIITSENATRTVAGLCVLHARCSGKYLIDLFPHLRKTIRIQRVSEKNRQT
jgi:hypothetical protein